jgi:SRSO17 transposase
MERRYELRQAAMLAECRVTARTFDGVLDRLVEFTAEYAEGLAHPQQRLHARNYLSGLLSDVERKNCESIAYSHDQDRRGLQRFIGEAEWDHQPLLMKLARQVGREIGEDDGVIVIDPSSFPKKGKQSVGVARQWCGRLGKVENCQVGIYLGYVSRMDRALTNFRLYLPEDWAKHRKRRKAAGVPKSASFHTRHHLALEMLDEQSEFLPHAWVAGDDEMGRNAAFRRDLHVRGEQYLLAVPCNTLLRDLDIVAPEHIGRGVPRKVPFQRVDAWRDAVPREAWKKIFVRDGAKGPLEVEVVACRVQTKISQRVMPYEETLVIVRSLDEDGATKHDFYLSDAPRDTPLKEFARVALAAHRVEEAIQRCKSETGLAHYEVRTWRGWHHHQALSLIAAWFLTLETQRGKKIDPGPDPAANAHRHRNAHAASASATFAQAN